MIVSLIIPDGFSSADWNVRLHVGAQATTVSAAGNSGSGSIPTADVGGGGVDTIPESTVGLISTRRSRRLNRVLDNRDLCRIVSAFIPERNYRS